MVRGQTTVHLASVLMTVCLRLQRRERLFWLGYLVFRRTAHLRQDRLDPEIPTTGLSKLAFLGHLRVQLHGIGASQRSGQIVLDTHSARIAMVLRLEALRRILMRSKGLLGRVKVFRILRTTSAAIMR